MECLQVRAAVEGRFDDKEGKLFLDPKNGRPEMNLRVGRADIVQGLDEEIIGTSMLHCSASTSAH
jgi:hypothetical protein